VNELNRAVALLIAELEAPSDELRALGALLSERSRASVDYHLTRRGQYFLEKADAIHSR